MSDSEPVPEHALGPLLRDIRAASLDLTDREKLCLRLMSHGLTRQMVGDELHWSKWTVDDVLERAAIKLKAKNTRHACCIALRLGLFP